MKKELTEEFEQLRDYKCEVEDVILRCYKEAQHTHLYIVSKHKDNGLLPPKRQKNHVYTTPSDDA